MTSQSIKSLQVEPLDVDDQPRRAGPLLDSDVQEAAESARIPDTPNQASEGGTEGAESETSSLLSDTRSNIRFRGVVQEWKLEIGSLLFSLFSFGSIIGVLAYYNGKETPGRLITVNTLVAFLSTLARILLMIPAGASISQLKWIWFATGTRRLFDFHVFDELSRGEVGALKIVRHPIKGSLPWIGMFITLIPLFASAFNQQAITQELRLVSKGIATIPRTDSVIPKDGSVNDKFGVSGQSTNRATYIGLWTNFTESIPAVEPLCSTGNCTWPTYRSVGVCADMADVSHLLKKPDPTVGTLVRTLPNGAFLNISATGVNALNITAYAPTLAFQDVPLDHRLANIFVIIDYSVGEGTNTSAVEVLLSLCVREYSTSVRNGRSLSNETIMERDNNTNFGIRLNFDQPGTDSVFHGSTSDGMPTTGTAALFAQAAYTPPYQENLLAIMKNVATSLTNCIRTEAGDGNIATGQALVSIPHIRVVWRWIAAFACLELLACIILVGTIYQTYRAAIASWKSSSLANLYAHDLERDGNLKASSRNIRRRLRTTGPGKWSLEPESNLQKDMQT